MFVYAVLVLLLVATSLRQATAVCPLCFDGAPITKPDYALGLSGELTILTCQDLENALVFMFEEDTLCGTARAVSTLCGCPNLPPNACTMCGGGNVTRPLQNLDGLVDLGDVLDSYGAVDFFGLTPNCALLASGINVFDKDSQDCSRLPMDDLELYCGCPSDEIGSDAAVCTLCPGGEIVPDVPENNLILNTSEKQISCAEAQNLVEAEEHGSDLCNDFQRGSTACGCPVPENSCELCPGGEITSPSTRLDTIFGIRQDCITLSHQLHRYDLDSAECQSIDDSYRETCGCEKEAEWVPCTLCPMGEPVPYPEKEIVGIEGLGFDFLREHNCGLFEAAALVTDENEERCTSARLLAKVCGCAVPETACNLCEGDTPLSNPFREYQWEFGSITDTLPDIYQDWTISGKKLRCELVDSLLNAVYDHDDGFCYFSQLIRGNGCGCHGPNNTKVIALVWTQRCSGLLSLIGSITIIVAVLTKKTKSRWNTYNQIVLSISVFDSLSSMAYIFGTALTPVDLGFYGSVGNEGTCVFQGWLFQIGMTSVYYNLVLCLYFLVSVKYNWTERKFQKIRKWVHLGVLVFGLAMSLSIIPFVTADWRWCYLSKPPYYESWFPGLFFFILPIGFCMICMTVLTAFFIKFVRQVEMRSSARKLNVGGGPNIRSMASRTFWQSFYFLAAFYTVWPIQFVAFLVPLVASNYWVYLLAALLGPLQGFLNAMVVFYRDRKTLSKRFQNLLRIIKERLRIRIIQERLSTMFSSPFKTNKASDSKLSANMRASPSERPNSKASAVSLKRPTPPELFERPTSPNELLNMNEEQKVQEDVEVLGDAGIASQSDLTFTHGASQSTPFSTRFRNDEFEEPVESNRRYSAMLECAANAGLLTEDECAMYQDRIESTVERSSGLFRNKSVSSE